jgi:NTE family protein
MNNTASCPNKAFGLALSGGGVRAAAFHAGVLRYFAERKWLENIEHISSVSGGSLFVGLVFHHADTHWPDSETYLKEVFPRFRQTLTTLSLQGAAIKKLVLNPLNWRFALSRANIMAQTIQDVWGVKTALRALDARPVWSINCSTGETGHRYRFRNGTMGDYESGCADIGNFSLASAMASSAAFPGGIGPLTIETKKFHWMKRKQWDDGEPEPFQPPFKQLHLYDGGLYDNLGVEPLFDSGQQSLKEDAALPTKINYLLVSDSEAPLTRQPIPGPLNPFRLERIIDIGLGQCRALHVRAFVNFLRLNPTSGAYAGIGTAAVASIRKFATGREAIAEALLKQTWLSAAEARQAATYSTNLKRLDEAMFDLLQRHGYETVKWNVELMSQFLPPDSGATARGGVI